MSVTILHTAPTSGQYPEKHFGQHFSSQLWIEFEDNYGNKWNGCFAKEPNQGIDCALASNDNQTAFIVAGGLGYLISIQTRELLVETDCPPVIESAIVTTNPDYFLVGTSYDIKVFDSKELVREIKPNQTVDGIYLKEQKDNKALGELSSYAYDGYKLTFDIDLTTFEMDIKDELKIKHVGPLTVTSVQPVGQIKKPGLLERLFKRK